VGIKFLRRQESHELREEKREENKPKELIVQFISAEL
jgi:hypothetical protein